jgi:hypothetical protein
MADQKCLDKRDKITFKFHLYIKFTRIIVKYKHFTLEYTEYSTQYVLLHQLDKILSRFAAALQSSCSVTSNQRWRFVCC